MAATILKATKPSVTLTAANFIRQLAGGKTIRPAKDDDPRDFAMGIGMKTVFDLAKEYMNMPASEIEKLLESPVYEIRTGAVSIMDWKARNKKTTEEERKALYQLYMKRHDRINHWGQVDRAAPYVVGGYLFDKDRTPLYKLARSKKTMERRTAIVATYYFIRQNDVDDTFKIAELLVADKEHFVQTAVGGWIREAGKRDKKQLLAFLDKYASKMPPTMLRYAIEKLSDSEKKKYRGK